MEALLSIEKAAETLGISPWTVRAYLREGKLQPVRIGRRVLLQPGELERFVLANLGNRVSPPEQNVTQ